MNWRIEKVWLRSNRVFWDRKAVSLLVTTSLLLGCSSTGNLTSSLRPVYFQQQNEAGSIQVGVQSVAPFEEYVDALQPKFSLTEKDALDTAIAQTQIENLREIRTLLGKIAIALPSTTKAVEEVLNRQNDTTTSTRTETQKETPPTQPAAAAPADTSTLTGVPEAPAGTVAIDAALRYRAAAALYQDIALLSSYVREAAVARDTTPYIVRLLVTVLPSSRRAAYDAYTTVSFFLDTQRDGQQDYSAQLYLAAAAARAPAGWQKSYQKTDPTAKDLKCDGRSVQVVPLFVTDNFESSSQTAARESLRGFEASAGGTISNIGIGGGLNTKQDASLGIRGTDLNGIQTLAATSENTIQLRLGAVSTEGGFQAIPRTYNLTALVLAPSQVVSFPMQVQKELVLACGRVRFSAQSFFRRADGGTLLPSLDTNHLKSTLKAQLDSEFGAGINSTKAIESALLFDFDGFTAALTGKKEQAAALWPKVVTLVNSWGGSGGTVPLPTSTFSFFGSDVLVVDVVPGGIPKPTPRRIKVPILDDGKISTATLYGAERLEEQGKGLHAQLSFQCNGQTIGIDNDSVSVSKDRRGATFTFPSVKAFTENVSGKKCELPALADLRVDFSQTVQRWSRPEQQITYVADRRDCPILVIEDKGDDKKDEKKAEIDLRATTDFIRAKKDGTGEFAIEIRKTGKAGHTVLFTVEGAILQTVSDPQVVPEGVFRKGKTDSAYVLSVKSLLVGRRVTVHTWQAGDKAEDKPLPGPDVSLIVIPEIEAPDCHFLAGRCPTGP